MENKYFTPDIEDLCIGYELEVHYNFKLNGIFHKKIIENFEELADIHSRMSGDCVIRVPYLTKEQIEAEGWYKVDDNYPIQKFKHLIEVDVEVIYNYESHHLFITIPGKIMFVTPNIEYRANKFSGECKDINTFRKIIKLLNI